MTRKGELDDRQAWLDVIALGTSEIASTMQLGPAAPSPASVLAGAVVEGADVTLEGANTCFLIRFRCGAGQGKTLAARLLRLPPGIEPDEDDVADALCELSNMMAGKLKAGMRRRLKGARIGLPVYAPAAAERERPPLSVCFDVDGVPLRVDVVQREAA